MKNWTMKIAIWWHLGMDATSFRQKTKTEDLESKNQKLSWAVWDREFKFVLARLTKFLTLYQRGVYVKNAAESLFGYYFVVCMFSTQEKLIQN